MESTQELWAQAINYLSESERELQEMSRCLDKVSDNVRELRDNQETQTL